MIKRCGAFALMMVSSVSDRTFFSNVMAGVKPDDIPAMRSREPDYEMPNPFKFFYTDAHTVSGIRVDTTIGCPEDDIADIKDDKERMMMMRYHALHQVLANVGTEGNPIVPGAPGGDGIGLYDLGDEESGTVS